MSRPKDAPSPIFWAGSGSPCARHYFWSAFDDLLPLGHVLGPPARLRAEQAPCHVGSSLRASCSVFPYTTEDLATAGGVTVNTIFLWRQAGFFDGVESTLTGGNSSGVRRRWSESAKARVLEIVAMKKAGLDTSHIQKKLGVDPVELALRLNREADEKAATARLKSEDRRRRAEARAARDGERERARLADAAADKRRRKRRDG